MHERGYQLGNVDITIIAQQPKLSPHKEKMRDQLCLLLGSHPSTVNIKASAHVLFWLLAAVQICTTKLALHHAGVQLTPLNHAYTYTAIHNSKVNVGSRGLQRTHGASLLR